MKWEVQPGRIEGSISVPGDKSIAHRALMLSAMAPGTSRIENLPRGEDVLATAQCMRKLGARIDITERNAHVEALGIPQPPTGILNAGNSGTTMRLLAGILCGQRFASRIEGDSSLSRRPMSRIIEPLEQMGARIQSDEGRAPLDIEGAVLQGIRYTLPIPSAQVKSAILFAGLFARGETSVIEPVPTRDHTERMLRAVGVQVSRSGDCVTVHTMPIHPFNLYLPGDASSAAFFFAAGALTGGEILVRNVGVNPTRIGFLHAIQRMGVTVEMTRERMELGEPVADVRTRGRVTNPLTIEEAEVPLLIDEIPLLALLATAADGTSTIQGAGELRFKETDRIAAVATALRALGARIDELPNGFVVNGPQKLTGATVSSDGDHRLAMMLAVAGSAAEGETVIDGAQAAGVSYPRFERALAELGGRIVVA